MIHKVCNSKTSICQCVHISAIIETCTNHTFVCLYTYYYICMWNLDHKEGWVPKVKVTQSYLTLCDHMDYTVHGILQARILEWVALSFSRGSSQPRDWTIAGRSPALHADSLPGKPGVPGFREADREALSAKGLMLLKCGTGEGSWESLGLQDQTSQS